MEEAKGEGEGRSEEARTSFSRGVWEESKNASRTLSWEERREERKKSASASETGSALFRISSTDFSFALFKDNLEVWPLKTACPLHSRFCL